ncbi:hypothetical protein ACWCQK_26635 [Streptomyces sp. NPDC002306]
MTTEWYVLIEEDYRTSERLDGVDVKLHHWRLAGTHHIGEDESQAAEAAEDAALHYIPDVLARHTRPGDEPARHAFLTGDGVWVVLLKQRHRACHIRVSVARLAHTFEEKEAPAKSLKDMLRGAFEAPPAPVKSWTPPGAPERD